jgi:hypothetical protein
MPWQAWTTILQFVFSFVAGITGTCYCTNHWLWRGLANFLPGQDSNCDPHNFCLPKARSTGLCHCTYPRSSFINTW